MRLIAHRGNVFGPNPEKENTFEYLKETIKSGFDVEADIWEIDSRFFLGHDAPTSEIKWEDIKLIQPFTWFHAKNLAALNTLMRNRIHVFFHDKDDYTITSKGFVWAYSGKDIGPNGIACMPESTPGFIVPSDVYGVCSDNLFSYIPGAIA